MTKVYNIIVKPTEAFCGIVKPLSYSLRLTADLC